MLFDEQEVHIWRQNEESTGTPTAKEGILVERGPLTAARVH